MDRTVSRRSEPRSRTALMGKQPNTWNILQAQSTFYPLSDDPSTRHCRITKADFHPWSTGGLKETFARLHYLLGCLHPIEIFHLRLSLSP
ncbi:hypothetical protein NC653_031997 [Populus alba x Populus x berolinensis]|uniref:Uncharacterized protein n=1 Tax=Populus alba x Populus x berolinensis TaxID=444605 RepID=A0AAD6Q3E6_9ROSI|nr:hypothetical protein NC653_031997 [Populus alba x Populus x berolinensis]